VLVELEGKRLLDWLPPNWEDEAPHLNFETDGRVAGYTGVNRMGSNLDGAALVRGEFLLAPIVTTRRAGPPELMHLEARYSAALQRARGVRLLGDTLALTPGPDSDRTIARFSRAPGGER
jgi:heat shock protein HslJ